MGFGLPSGFAWITNFLAQSFGELFGFITEWAVRLSGHWRFLLLPVFAVITLLFHQVGFAAASVFGMIQLVANIVDLLSGAKGEFSNFDWGPYEEVLSLTNGIFPLAEAIAMIIAYGAFVVSLLVYRVAKSWIPTVSG